MNAPIIAPERGLLTHEEIFEAVTTWLRAPGKSRELKLDVGHLGLFCRLLESGQLQGLGRGRDADTAILDALDRAGAL